MITIRRDIPSFALLSQLEELTIFCNKVVTFELSQAGQTVFSEKYIPDGTSLVRIFDFCALVEPSLREEPLLEFQYRISADGETPVTKSFVVLMARVRVPIEAISFCNNYFLSCLGGQPKQTSPGRRELLSLTSGAVSGSGTIPVSVECVFVDEKNVPTTETRQLDAVSAVGVHTIDVSPTRFLKEGALLVRYTVIAGKRRQVYRVGRQEEEPVGVSFLNAFGCRETFYFRGLIKLTPEIERSMAYMGGQYKTYRVEEQLQHELNTGFLPSSMYHLADDMSRSVDTRLITPSGEVDVAIVDSDTERTTDNKLFSFTVTYIRSSRQQAPFLFPYIFDNTFDKSFN